MKKFALSSLSLALLGAAGAAHAQSSVTLYGIADAGFLFNNNVKGSKLYGLSSANSSRWGVQGTEDLGGGLKAFFTLENGYTLGTGALSQGGLEFGRKAFVGLKSDTYGAVVNSAHARLPFGSLDTSPKVACQELMPSHNTLPIRISRGYIHQPLRPVSHSHLAGQE